jgi:hypothetical protein
VSSYGIPAVHAGKPPVPQAERYRLLTVANGPIEVGPDGQPIRIYGGVTYEPTYCGESHDYPVVCGPEDPRESRPAPSTKVFDPLGDFVEADPFVIYSTLLCGGAGHENMAQWMREKTLLRFAAGEATGVERNFARILAASSAPLLTPADSTNIVSVVATLEQWLYGVQDVLSSIGPTEGIAYNYRGYLHAPPRVAAYAAAEHLVDQQGAYKVTPLGTVWVFGGGYSGALPGAAAAVDGTDAVYITGQVTIWRDPEIQMPSMEQTFDRETNQWFGLAERAYAAAFDCGAAAAPFEYGAVSP